MIYKYEECSGLTSVTIGNSVTSIGRYAFYGCRGLTSVTIPNSVTSIGECAFASCSGLTSVTIGNSVTSIVEYAFGGCSGLTSIKVESGNTIYDSRDNCNAIIETATNKLIAGCKNSTIPNSVTSIGGHAFTGCSGLTSVTIPNSVTSIGSSAFASCSGLTSVTIPNSVTSIGSNAFYGCSGLTSVTIGNSVTSIDESAFYGCYRLNTIYSLNPIPPTCYNSSTFECSSSNVRDKYDVYTYATLHVPMGSEEVYSSAHEWRYFNKIKEDMESGGKVHYANLTVQQGTTGYTRQAMKAAERYTIYIGSLGENRVNAVTFNGEDVTDDVVDGYYTTPEIKGESVLSISFEAREPSYVKARVLADVRVTGYNGEISINHIDEPSDVYIYTTDGKLVNKIPAAFGSTSLQVPSGQLYVVKVGERTYKLAM